MIPKVKLWVLSGGKMNGNCSGHNKGHSVSKELVIGI